MTATGKSLLAVAAVLLGFSIAMHLSIAFWGDQDWELLVAHMLLSGRKLYLDEFAVNPPLIFYLYTVPAWLAMHLTWLEDYQALVALMLCAIALVICLSIRLLDAHPGFADNPGRRWQLIVLLCFLFIFRIASPYFGDREHIFLVFTFPYLLRWLPSISNTPLSGRMKTLIGLLAGIGFCIKPHCALPFVGIQIACLLHRNRPRILTSLENAVIYGVFTAYFLAVAIITPDYFSTVVPMAYLTYSAISGNPGTRFDYTIIATLALTFIMFRPRQTSPWRKDIYYLLLVSLFYFGYALVNGGWNYTYQPILTLILLINGFVLWEFGYFKAQVTGLGRRWTFLIGQGACLFNFAAKTGIVLVYFVTVLDFPCIGDTKCPGYYIPYAQELVSREGPRTFGTIGMNFALWSRAAKLSGAEWETRFSQLWMVPKFIISTPEFANKNQWILKYVADALAQDLNERKPEIVFVDASDIIYTIRLRQPFNWVGAFGGYDSFKQAFSHYTYQHTVDGCADVVPAINVGYAMEGRYRTYLSDCRYDVYRREP